MPAPSRLLLSGYFGFANLGDEAIFEAMVGALRKFQPDVELTALMADPSRARQLGVRAVPRKNLSAVAQAIRASDLVISGGGGLVQDSTGVGSVAYYLGVTRLAHLLGKPTMFYAQGFGPVRSDAGKWLTRILGRTLTLVTLRDESSADDLRALGLSQLPIHVTADPALLLEPPPPKEMLERLNSVGLGQELSRMDGPTGRHPGSGPLVAVTVRPWEGLREDDLIEALRQFQEQEKARYLILPFHPEKDEELSRRVCARLQGPHRILGQDWSPAEITGLLRCCDMVVGMRLHSLILAAGAGVPSLGLSYDPKVERFCQRAGALPLRLEEATQERIATHLHHLLTGRAQVRKLMRERVEPMKLQAEQTARAALALAQPLPRRQALQQARAVLNGEAG